MGIQTTGFDTNILDEQDLKQTRTKNSCRYISFKHRDKEVKLVTRAINSCPYLPTGERDADYEKIMDDSYKEIGFKDIARPSPRKEIFSKSRYRSEKSCHYIASRKYVDQTEKKPLTTDNANTRRYVNPGEHLNEYQTRSTKEPESNRENESLTTSSANTHWYVNPGDLNNQPRSNELGSSVECLPLQISRA